MPTCQYRDGHTGVLHIVHARDGSRYCLDHWGVRVGFIHPVMLRDD